MAVGVTEIKTVCRLVFDLERDEETTSRSIEIPYGLTEDSSAALQQAINATNTKYTSSSYNVMIQPANWRDNNIAEEQWVTKGVRYEISTVTTTPITPETPVTLGSAQENQPEEHHEEHQQEQQS